MKKLVPLLIIPVLGLIGLFFFKYNTQDNPVNTGGKLSVSTSFYPLYFFSSQIGGDKAIVYNVTPAGAEPHDYEPSTRDTARIEDGDMLVINGGVETWVNKIEDSLKGSKVKVVVAGQELLTKELSEEGETIKDPHVWLDPQFAKVEVAKITAGYISLDPQNTDYYRANEQQLDSRLDQLDGEYSQGLQNCQSKDVITSHAAFAYLTERYGLNQVAISGVSPDEEPSAKQLADVAAFARENSVKYIFFESLVSPKLSQTIAQEVGAKTLVLDPIEGLSDDDIKQGKDYFSVMRSNLKNLQEALQCSQ